MNAQSPGGLSEDEQERRRQAIAELMPTTLFLRWMGVSFDRYERDDVVLRVPFREDLTNDGVVYHGGVIAAAIDTAGAAVAWSNHDFDKGVRASTVSMSLQYVGAAKNSDLLCQARTIKRGKELTFTQITATDADGMVVAHAVQTYRIT
ncbi:MAG: PaaI family thioesterase [Acidimicrobiales bacterium]